MKQSKTPVSMETLSDRICKRLADIAQEMAVDPRPIWVNHRKELAALTEKSFRVIFDLRQDRSDALASIESAINDNTHPFVQATHGKFSFGDDFMGMFTDPGVSLITFDTDTCTQSQQRYIALMVVQRFESLLEATPATGRLSPAGITVPKYYGVIESQSFDQLAFFLNGALGKHALPENKFPGQVYEPQTSIRRTPKPGA